MTASNNLPEAAHLGDLEAKLARFTAKFERERSARKEAEKIAEKGLRDLFLANRNLDEKVAERTAQLEAETRKAEKAAQSRYQFLASLSRQVRTPLNGVTGMLELLNSQTADAQAKIWLASATSSAGDLLRLFARLVIFVELDELEPPQLVETKVSLLLRSFEEKWGHTALAAGKLIFVENRTPNNAEILTDEHRVQQLFDEVMDNVVRHTNPGAVKVIVENSAALPATTTLTIRDPGPGITDENLRYGAQHGNEFGDTLGVGYSLIEKLATLLDIAVEQHTTPTATEMELRFPPLK